MGRSGQLNDFVLHAFCNTCIGPRNIPSFSMGKKHSLEKISVCVSAFHYNGSNKKCASF